MRKFFYPRLALQNIGKHRRVYISYMITCVITIAMFYIMSSLTYASMLGSFFGGEQVRIFLAWGTYIIGFFALIFLFYTHSFIVKRRKKEFGLYNILGMEKKHISIMLFYETLYCAVITLSLGILLGIALYKAAQLLMLKLVHLDVEMGFYISGDTIKNAIILFGIIFLLSYLNTLRQIHLSNPIELLHGSNMGEKEPKARILLVILGLLCLGGGYYISITVISPLEAVLLFFVAVILVIIGTYLLFTSVTIAVLKLLRKNKKYYYNPKHFTFVSGMLYRMKQNAVGLANICILSTMVLVMLSTSILLYISIDDLARNSHPRNIMITADNVSLEQREDVEARFKAITKKEGLEPINLQSYLQTSIMLSKDGDQFKFPEDSSASIGSAAVFLITTLDDYNTFADSKATLENDNDILIHTIHGSELSGTLTIENLSFNICGKISSTDFTDQYLKYMSNIYLIIVRDEQVHQEILTQFAPWDQVYMYTDYLHNFDLDMSDQEQREVLSHLREAVNTDPQLADITRIQGAAETSDSYLQLYGGLLFLGLFLGTLFIMATVLIIYYKQITEGYEDQMRFEIMQNVGMSSQEVKTAIHSQVLSVFYLPLGMACIHTLFAFPIISRLLALMNMTNMTLFFWGLAGTILVFALFYTLVYMLTAKVYYRIVSSKSKS